MMLPKKVMINKAKRPRGSGPVLWSRGPFVVLEGHVALSEVGGEVVKGSVKEVAQGEDGKPFKLAV